MLLFLSFKGNNRIEEYFSIVFYEIVYLIGYKIRLDCYRYFRFGDWYYVQEELVVEIGSVFFFSMYGLDILEIFKNNVVYINYWLE